MEPGLPVGTVVLARDVPASTVDAGDVVAVDNGGRRIVHRVRSTADNPDGSVTLIMRGDRNRAADPPVTVRAVQRPVFTIPLPGELVETLSGRWTQFWLGVFAALIAGIALVAPTARQRRAGLRPGPGPAIADHLDPRHMV